MRWRPSEEPDLRLIQTKASGTKSSITGGAAPSTVSEGTVQQQHHLVEKYHAEGNNAPGNSDADRVAEATGCSFQQAQTALEQAGGSVDEACMSLL